MPRNTDEIAHYAHAPNLISPYATKRSQRRASTGGGVTRPASATSTGASIRSRPSSSTSSRYQSNPAPFVTKITKFGGGGGRSDGAIFERVPLRPMSAAGDLHPLTAKQLADRLVEKYHGRIEAIPSPATSITHKNRPTSPARTGSRPQSASIHTRPTSATSSIRAVSRPTSAVPSPAAVVTATSPQTPTSPSQPLMASHSPGHYRQHSSPVRTPQRAASPTRRRSYERTQSPHPAPTPLSPALATPAPVTPARVSPTPQAILRQTPHTSSPKNGPSPIVEHLFESSESRLRSLHLQAWKAGCLRDFDSLISLRVEMLAFNKMIGGRRSPNVVLASLHLADAYLRAGLPRQAVDHAQSLPARLEEMQYAQGLFDCYMLLGHAYHALALEAEAEHDREKESLKTEEPQPVVEKNSYLAPPSYLAFAPKPAGSISEVTKLFEKSIKQFGFASALTIQGHEKFFQHTTIRSQKDMDAITVKKRQEANLALASTQASLGLHTHEQETLTGCWENLEAHLATQRRRDEAELNSQSTNDTHNSHESLLNPDDYDINSSLQALELYTLLSQCFYSQTDDVNCIDNLRRVIGIAEKHGAITFGMVLDENIDSSQYPHPSQLSFHYLTLLLDSLILLPKSLERVNEAREAIVWNKKVKSFLLKVKEYNKILNSYYNQNTRSPVAATDGTVPPQPTHVPTSSTEVSHSSIDTAWNNLVEKEWFYYGNKHRSYDFASLESFIGQNLIQIEKDLAHLHISLCEYEEAAAHQEEVCMLLEQDQLNETPENMDDDNASTTASVATPSIAPSIRSHQPTTPSTSIPAAGIYQLPVAKAHKRLGDIYTACGQPRTARASYQQSLQILETMYGCKKIHDVHVKYSTHSGYKGADLVKRNAGAIVRRITTGFGSTLPYGFVQNPPTVKAEERLVPPGVQKLLKDLRHNIKILTKEIDAANAAANPGTNNQQTEQEQEEVENQQYQQEEESKQQSYVYDSYAFQSATTSSPESYVIQEDGQPTASYDNATNQQPDPTQQPIQSNPSDDATPAVALVSEEPDQYPADSDFEQPQQPSQLQEDEAYNLDSIPPATSPKPRRTRHAPQRSFDSIRESNVVPPNPHVRRAERSHALQGNDTHIVGESGIFNELLIFRTIGSPEKEAERIRASAYDAFTMDKALPDEPTKMSRQTRPLSATPKKVVKPTQTNGIEPTNEADTTIREEEPTANEA